ncbi:MAG TPA: GNAT family N-acetyltransferase [Vicinamibacteria bacterium]|nr:GNAT family N-acetyltransferase [Vicinamibacteria bacterium]
MASDLRLRAATREDAPTILDLIRGLAAYEREPDAAVVTEADILRDGFGERPLFEVVIAEWKDEPAGFALFFPNWSTWQGRAGLYLEDLFVRESHRGLGIGKALLVHLARVAVARGYGRFVWQVLDWNKPAIDFYEALGARHLKEWQTMRVEGEALRRLAALATP